MNYINLFTNGGQGMETKPAGTAMDISLNGNDKPVEPAQATKQQEPIPIYSQERKGCQKASKGLYADKRSVEAGRWFVRMMKKYTKIPPGTMTNDDFNILFDECFAKSGKTFLEDVIVFATYATVCDMQGHEEEAMNILFYLQDKALNCTDKSMC